MATGILGGIGLVFGMVVMQLSLRIIDGKIIFDWKRFTSWIIVWTMLCAACIF
jgi:hypothetical protein